MYPGFLIIFIPNIIFSKNLYCVGLRLIDKILHFHILVVFVLLISSCSQNKLSEKEFMNLEFDSVYTVIATETSATDLELSFRRTDSLMKVAENDFQIMKTWMLLATLHRRSGELAEALAHATLASELAEKNKFYNWQVRISGFLSTTFREADLPDEARHYLQKAETANRKLEKTSGYHMVQLMIHQEKAYFLIDEDQDYTAAIEELHNANAYYDKLPPDLPSMSLTKATTDQLLGLCYYYLGQFSLSKSYYDASLKSLGDVQYGLEPFVWLGMGDVMMEQRDYDSAFEYYEKANEARKKSENFQIKLGLHKSLADYYNAVGNDEEAYLHQREYTSLLKERRAVARNISGEILQILKDEKENTALLSRAFFIIIVILIVLIPGILLSKRKIRGDTTRSIFIFSNKNGRRGSESNSSEEERAENSLAISAETEARVLTEIEALEEKEYYLDSNLSMSSVATLLETNTKYIAYVIHKYRSQDFTSYINSLRIEKAMGEIRSNPDNLNYKISYLAGEFGFSSHASFTNAFKKIAGMSPSQFINQVRKETTV